MAEAPAVPPGAWRAGKKKGREAGLPKVLFAQKQHRKGLAEQRDRRRFRMRDLQPRTLQTLFGVDITFRRRRYLDRQTGETVYLLDEVLNLPAQTQLSPALGAWAMGQAVLTNSYRAAARSLEAL